MASLQKNVAGQNFTFCMVNATTGAADAGATVTVKVVKDNGAQGSGGGSVTNSGNGQYNYAPTQAETNATDVGFLLTATNDIPVNIDFHTDNLPANFSSLSIDVNGNVAITSNVKKNTASSGFEFLMTDSTTHNPKTGLTITSTRSIDGGAFGATTNTASEVASGIYSINLSAGDVNGNHIVLLFTSAGADNRYVEIITQP